MKLSKRYLEKYKKEPLSRLGRWIWQNSMFHNIDESSVIPSCIYINLDKHYYLTKKLAIKAFEEAYDRTIMELDISDKLNLSD